MRNACPWLVATLVIALGCGEPGEIRSPDPEPPAELDSCEITGGIILPDGRVVTDLLTALVAAEAGGELQLCPGRYHGNFTVDVPIRLRGLGGASVTILHGISDSPTLKLPGGSEITGLTIRGGGGIHMSTSGTLRVENSVISGSQADYGAGLVVAERSDVTLAGTVITANLARVGGGGVWVKAGGHLKLVDGSRVSGNWARRFGAGIWLQDAHLTGGLVSDNLLLADAYSLPQREADGALSIPAETFGGSGVALSGDGSLTGTEITGNLGVGGALSVLQGTVALADVWIHQNHAGSANGLRAGGIAVADAHVVAEGSTRIERNTAYRDGGGWLFGGSINGVTVADNDAFVCGGLSVNTGGLRNVVVSGNTASGGSGGGLCVSGRVKLDDVKLLDNHSSNSGGAIDVAPLASGTDVEIVRSRIFGNQATRHGGAIHVTSWWWMPDSAKVIVSDSEINDNSAVEVGGGAYTDAPLTIENSRVVANSADHGGGVYVAEAGVLTIVSGDLGVADDENTPDDIATPAASYQGYGIGVTITCDVNGCTPEA